MRIHNTPDKVMLDPAAVAAPVAADIANRLAACEQTQQVEIIYAIESGSRAWGFHSPDSDFDCRFVYVRPLEWYLSLDVEKRRDVIEYPIVDEIDINGWDLRKALQLLAVCNPSIVEWLYSPLIYRERGDFAEVCRAWLKQYYAIEKGIYHYRASAQRNYQQFLRGTTVKLKKYLYVLRPLLAVRWLQAHGTIAPIEFDQLRNVLNDAEVQQAIDALLVWKKQASETAAAAPIKPLQHWIEQELARLADYREAPPQAQAGLDELNMHFRRWIQA